MNYTIIILLFFVFAFPGSSYAASDEVKNCIQSIDVFEDAPEKPYSLLSPLRAKSGTGLIWRRSPSQLLKKIKKKACKMNADAIVNFQCYETVSGKGSFRVDKDGGRGSSRTTSVPVCTASAVKWK